MSALTVFVVSLATLWCIVGYKGSMIFMQRYLDYLYDGTSLAHQKPSLGASDRLLAILLAGGGLVTVAMWALLDRSDRRKARS